MIVVRNNIIPFKGYKAISLYPFIFVRKDCPFDEVDKRHEEIHGRQQVEMVAVGIVIATILYLITKWEWWFLFGVFLFYIWYIVEWGIRLFINKRPYRSISFEQEAYSNENNEKYLSHRKLFAWIKYLTIS